MSMEKPAKESCDLTNIDIIQGGMGVGVSWHKLAGAVMAEGALGVVSGTVAGPVLARRLQDGDPDGYMREALSSFPDQDIAEQIRTKYYKENGRAPEQPYKTVPVFNATSRGLALNLNMVGAFVEVWLAKRIAFQKTNRPGPVGINLLTKLQEPTLSALYGAMLAGVDCVIMGAGIPHDIPKQIETLALGERASIQFDVTGSNQEHRLTFDPSDYPNLQNSGTINIPRFLAVVASNTLVTRLHRNNHPPSGFVIEGPTAGGHNAPPRDKSGYGNRDIVNLENITKLDPPLPFWLAGGYGSPEMLTRAKENGANGIQVGTAFFASQDSGLDPTLRTKIINEAMRNGVEIKTDILASPTGFPFKVAQLAETISDDQVRENRKRVCDLGFLREAYVNGLSDNGAETIGYRCAAEPQEDYVAKGGNIVATIGCACLCNGLLATIGLGQKRHGSSEVPIVTAGDNLTETIRRIVGRYSVHFSAKDVISFLRSDDKQP